ncbi:MAG: hypothetical protein JW751_12155 [Polyangiaceae bacterium]|nr:hypothetical protein [Polyangiaceae bacterium]
MTDSASALAGVAGFRLPAAVPATTGDSAGNFGTDSVALALGVTFSRLVLAGFILG